MLHTALLLAPASADDGNVPPVLVELGEETPAPQIAPPRRSATRRPATPPQAVPEQRRAAPPGPAAGAHLPWAGAPSPWGRGAPNDRTAQTGPGPLPGQSIAAERGGVPARPAGYQRPPVNNSPSDIAPRAAETTHSPVPARKTSAQLQPRSDQAPPREAAALPGRGDTAEEGWLSPPLVSTAASLGIVLGLFLLLAWVLHSRRPQAAVALPGEVLEVLGKSILPGKQQLHLVRCGGKLLLICVAGQAAETLTEITDPDEVARLTALCREANPRSSSQAFRKALLQLGRRGHKSGFVDEAGTGEASHA